VPVCDCSFDCAVSFTFTAHASPDSFEFDWLTSPPSLPFQTGFESQPQPPSRFPYGKASTRFVLRGAIWTASDVAFAVCVVLFEFDAFCDWSTSPP
jgi:hypothetical protein